MSWLDELIDGRRSIRKYKPDTPPVEWINSMITCASRAPSPSNSQPVRFIRICSPTTRDALGQAMISGRQRFLQDMEALGKPKRLRNWVNAYYRFSEFMFNAPFLFAVGTVASISGFSKKLVHAGILKHEEIKDAELDIAVGLALKGFLLKGEELGLGSCVLTAPLAFVSNIEDVLGIKDVLIKCLVTVGFPDEEPRRLERKGVGDIYSEV